ncbi:hypothetical protein P262_05551 [Cronobacter malonaticus]|uniref:Uncharacterized protein n=1 Tax=Cronobacter malonaticus TaxID=413503 RepID=V5U5N4_9ENTR|nr:hypothetical protein P262_05551 [Cronobacter malonaticus]CCJ94698.1 hypothetical protein BN131_2371 [Cronobacter malonaticus 681]CCK00020.1 hypothetical protein BN130_2764 [Cronobacter malonaticus 507]
MPGSAYLFSFKLIINNNHLTLYFLLWGIFLSLCQYFLLFYGLQKITHF